MRILITTDVVGGVWNYTVALVREMTARGHACMVAVIGRPGDARLAELPVGAGVSMRDLRLEWQPDGVADVRPGTEWLEGVARRWRPDVVHLGQFAFAVGHFSAPVVSVAHSDVFSWFREVRQAPPPRTWNGYRRAVRAGLHAADVVVAATDYQASGIRRHYGRAVDRIIHNGVSAPDDVGGPRPCRSAGSARVLTVGRAWDEAKGIRVLDDALAMMGLDAPEVRLAGPVSQAGGGTYRPDHLRALGSLDPVVLAQEYARADLYVGPSRYEPFGLAPTEAAVHGCALLLSDIGSFRELWQGSAAFFRPGDAADLARRLTDVLHDPAACASLGRRAEQRARTRYSTAGMASAYEALYRGLTSRTRPRRRTTPRTAPEQVAR